MRNTTQRLLALLTISVLLAGACGDDSGDEPSSTAPAASETQAPEVTEAPGEMEAPEVTEAPGEMEAPEVTEAPEETASDTDSGEELRVGLALNGPADDGGYNQSYFDGLNSVVDKYDLTVAVQENASDAQQTVDALRNLASTNDLVIAAGGQFAEAGTIVAPEFPDVEFAIVNGQTSDASNLHAFQVHTGYPAYAAGVVLASLTESNKVGFIGGLEIPPTFQAETGFFAGIEATEPDVERVSTFTGDYEDVALAKEAAIAQIAADVDVIYAYINAGIEGVIQAVEESGQNVRVVSVIFPRCDRSDHLFGTGTLSSAGQVDTIISSFLEGTLPVEKVTWGVEDPNIQTFLLCPAHSEPDLNQTVADSLASLAAGEIELS